MHKSENDEVMFLNLVFINGGMLKLTPNHLVCVGNGRYTSASEIKAG